MFEILTVSVALVDIDVAFRSDISARTSTRVASVDNAGLADRPRVAGVRGARVVQVAQKASLIRRTFANIASHAIMTSTSV